MMRHQHLFCSFIVVAFSTVRSQAYMAHSFTSRPGFEHRTLKHTTLLLRSTNEKDVPSNSRPDLPDYGTTTVEIDKIQLTAAKWRRQDLFGNSLVDQTVKEMGDNAEATSQLSREERAARRRSLQALDLPAFSAHLREKTGMTELRRKASVILQINIGLYCNQACGHCHVESSPLRTAEMMTAETAAQCLKLLVATPSITTLDITGGAPELNASFRYLVATARQLRPDIEIIDRCNLTVLQEPGQEDLVDFLKEHRVRIVASLPCYSAAIVDQQRGNGVFERSIAALLALNDAGYGVPGTNSLPLDLVYNPSGAFLPPPQKKLEDQYKAQLADNFGILFNELYTITNMPVKRFADVLHRRGELTDYMDLLVRNFNADTVDAIMCRDTVSVGYDGKVYDCDFNQQLGLGIGKGLTIFDLENLEQLQEYAVKTENHCYGCTAGMGSSCQGTTAE